MAEAAIAESSASELNQMTSTIVAADAWDEKRMGVSSLSSW
jgi:hypothetical protein